MRQKSDLDRTVQTLSREQAPGYANMNLGR